MKVLLDENLPHKLRHTLVGHEVSTVGYMGWNGFKNGSLLRVAEAEGFEVLVTGDQSLRYQQNFPSRRLSLLILSAIQWEILKNHQTEIVAAVDAAVSGSFREIQCGSYSRRRKNERGASGSNTL